MGLDTSYSNISEVLSRITLRSSASFRDCCLTPTEDVQLYHSDNKLHSMI